jgi:hypothetical protein
MLNPAAWRGFLLVHLAAGPDFQTGRKLPIFKSAAVNLCVTLCALCLCGEIKPMFSEVTETRNFTTEAQSTRSCTEYLYYASSSKNKSVLPPE